MPARLRINFIFFILTFLILSPFHKAIAIDSITINDDMIFDHLNDGNRSLNDKSLRIDIDPLYGTVYLGDWQRGVEAGGYLRDHRRSTYSGSFRLREQDHSILLGTDQVLGLGFVGKLETRFIHVKEPDPPGSKSDLLVYGIGFDKYYGDYHYFTAVYYNDPRKSGRFSVVISHTFATLNNSLRIGVVPRSDGKWGYFGIAKYHWLYLGYSFTRDFDFSTFDRQAVSLGAQIPFDLKWSKDE